MGPTNGPTLSVLLIEDDDDMRALLRTRLELDGRFTVVGEATNGAHGVGLATVRQPDAIVLDVLMPIVDGATALPLLRTAVLDAVIVSFSALPADHPRVAAMHGSDGHVCKTDASALPDALYAAYLSRHEGVAARS
jgi:DNA-binding NarL/FixJ family response regulator